MKSFCLNFLTAAFLLAQGMVMTYAQTAPGPTDILFFVHGTSQTWRSIKYGDCEPLDGSLDPRLVKVYHAVPVHCLHFTDPQCTKPSATGSSDYKAGLRDIPATLSGYATCQPKK